MAQEADLTGADDSVTFAITYRQGLGGGIYQFARVGRAALRRPTSRASTPATPPPGGRGAHRQDQGDPARALPLDRAGC